MLNRYPTRCLQKDNALRQGIYTDASYEKINDLVASKWYEIVNYLYPSAITSHSSAVNLRPIHAVIYISAPVKKKEKIKYW